MEISNFQVYDVGNVYNEYKVKGEVRPLFSSIIIEYPTRLNAMAIDPSGITENQNMHYSPGEVVFSTEIKIEVRISLNDKDDDVYIGENPNRISVVKHTCEIMRKALNYKGHFDVELVKSHDLRHCGLGSTGAIQASIGAGINYIFGNPIAEADLVKYLAQNYGEEIDGDETHLMPVQCIGGSAASGIYKGGVFVLAGENTIISTGTIGKEYEVVLGIPNNYKCQDSKTQFEEEERNIDKFKECGRLYRNQIAYNILHKFLPAMVHQDVKTMGDVIFDYRYNMGSIQNCSYTYEDMPRIMEELKFLKTEGLVDVLAISSVGPLVFAIGKNMDACKREFEKNDLRIYSTHINNDSFRILNEARI